MSVFAFRPEPQGQGMTADDLLTSGLDAPLSLGSTFWESAKAGTLESFGLGTAIRSLSLPEEAPTPPIGRAQLSTGRIQPENPEKLAARRADAGALSQERYKTSPWFRDGIPWDQGMTEDRAMALAEMDDVRKVREFYGAKRPVTAFMGKLLGSAVDPINYVPIFGEYVAGANVARFGYVAGRALTASADAMANTAIAGLATAPARGQLGDDVSWQSTVSQIAMAGLIGAGFGTAIGVAGRGRFVRRAEADARLATLKRTQEARVVLNDAIDEMARSGKVELSPASRNFIERAAQDVSYEARQGFEQPLRASVGPAETISPQIDPATGVEGFTVYHGSPYTFDRFSMEHIGAGEGAQAYGHGLYFAQEKGIAEGYQARISSNLTFLRNGEQIPSGKAHEELTAAAQAIPGTHPDQARMIARNILDFIEEDKSSGARVAEDYQAPRGFERQWEAAIKAAKDLAYNDNPGATYEVRIRANHEDFLDWDKPLSEQSPKVREALVKAGIDISPKKSADALAEEGLLDEFYDNDSGRELYERLARKVTDDPTDPRWRFGGKNPDVAAQYLHDLGVPGIKYLDAGSRAYGEGSRNFVVFDDSLLHTIRRNDEFIAKQPQDLRAKASASFAPEQMRLYDGETVRIADERIAATPADDAMPEVTMQEALEDVQRLADALGDSEIVAREMADVDTLVQDADALGRGITAAADCRIRRG